MSAIHISCFIRFWVNDQVLTKFLSMEISRYILIIVIVKCLYLLHFLFLSKKKKDTPWYKNVKKYLKYHDISSLSKYKMCNKYELHFFLSYTWTSYGFHDMTMVIRTVARTKLILLHIFLSQTSRNHKIDRI